MNLNFYEWTNRIAYEDGNYITFQGDFLNDSVPFKARFSVIDSSNNTDIEHIDAIFSLNNVRFVTSRGNQLDGGIAIDILKPWLISELRRNEGKIYQDIVLVTEGNNNYKFEYKVLSDIENYKIQYTYFNENPAEEWTVSVESDGEKLKHSGAVGHYSNFQFLKNFYDDFTIKKMNEIAEFKKIKIF